MGLGCDRRRREKCLSQNLVFKKYNFWHGSEVSKFGSRLCVKRLILPPGLEKLTFGVSNGYGVNMKVVGNDEISQTKLDWEFTGIKENISKIKEKIIKFKNPIKQPINSLRKLIHD